MPNLIGPDVSFYQDDPETPQGIDFAKMRASAGYVIIRAGQNRWPDPDFKANWREAKNAGLPRGSYWFYDSRADPIEQAKLWASLFEGDFGELPLFADFEENYKGPYAGWRKWYDFLENIKLLAPAKEIAIYTAYYYWRDNAPSAITQASSLEYFHQYPLWIANYGATEPSVPKPWARSEWLFWQFSEVGDGKLYGVETNGIDLNYFNGDIDAFRTRFNIPGTPPPPPGPGPNPPPPPGVEPPTGRKYKVTTTALRVREGPGTNFAATGMLYFGEVVDELVATNDKSWIKIQNKDGLIGWSSSAYLILTTGTTPPPVVIPPIEDDATKKWYRVNTSALYVRETPDPKARTIGNLLKDDTVPALDDTANSEWIKIRRLDGLTGWCSRNYLQLAGDARPASVRQNLFKGVTYLRNEIADPRKNVVHIMIIDLRTTGYEFLVTPTKDPKGIICTRTTSKFVDEFNVHVAINGDGFNYLDASFNSQAYCPAGGDPVKTNGFAASRGTIYSNIKNSLPTIYITRSNQVTIMRFGKVFNAITGDRIVVEKGKIPSNLATNIPNPRTAIGLSSNNRYLLFVVIDGRQPGYSEGVTLPELGNIMISHGIYTGVNMDGGGSSTMVIRGLDKISRVLNSPIDQNVAGKQRAVANHLGLFIK